MELNESNLRRIPTQFPTVKLKYGVNRRTEKIEEIDEELKRLSLSMVEPDTGEINLDPSSDLSTGLVRFTKEDVLFSKLRPYLAKAANPDFAGVASPEFLVLSPTKFEDEYLFYLLLSTQFIQRVDASTYGAKMPRASWDFVGDIHVPCPDLSVQRDISDWVADKVDNIDQNVEILRSLLDKTEEYSSAMITDSVGVASSPKEGRLSNIEDWLEVPPNWDVTKLKFLADVQTGVTKGSYDSAEDTISVPYLRVANVQDGHLDLSKVKEIEIPPSEVENYLLKPGDVLMNEGGDFDKLGRGTVWNGEISPCVHQNHVFAVRPKDPSYSEWISKLTESRLHKHYFKSKSKQSTNLASISVTDIKETPVILPPEKERKRILSEVENTKSTVDSSTQYAKSMIDSLEEMRKSIITAAVTGQIDVSDVKNEAKASHT
jgi:type I restriction enzyme S subunit